MVRINPHNNQTHILKPRKIPKVQVNEYEMKKNLQIVREHFSLGKDDWEICPPKYLKKLKDMRTYIRQ